MSHLVVYLLASSSNINYNIGVVLTGKFDEIPNGNMLALKFIIVDHL